MAEVVTDGRRVRYRPILVDATDKVIWRGGLFRTEPDAIREGQRRLSEVTEEVSR
jgi:hypothetical protein